MKVEVTMLISDKVVFISILSETNMNIHDKHYN